MFSPAVFRPGDIVSHGAYGEYALMGFKRHKYEGSDPDSADQGYAEVLEFPAPPEGRSKAVYHFYSISSGHTLVNFDSVENAMAFRFTGKVRRDIIERRQSEPDYLRGRLEHLGTKRPWFFCPVILVTGVPGGEGSEKMRKALVGLTLPTRGRFTEEFPKMLAMNWAPNAYRVPGNQLMYQLQDNGAEFAVRMWEAFYPGIRDVDIGITPDVCREM